MKVGIIGAGTMGAGIAQAFAQTEGLQLHYVILIMSLQLMEKIK